MLLICHFLFALDFFKNFCLGFADEFANGQADQTPTKSGEWEKNAAKIDTIKPVSIFFPFFDVAKRIRKYKK
jgi:hypothetical protein